MSHAAASRRLLSSCATQYVRRQGAASTMLSPAPSPFAPSTSTSSLACSCSSWSSASSAALARRGIRSRSMHQSRTVTMEISPEENNTPAAPAPAIATSGGSSDITHDSSDSPSSASSTALSHAPSDFSFEKAPQRVPKPGAKLAATIKLSSYSQDMSNLLFYTHFSLHAAYAFHLSCTRPSPYPIKTRLRTVPRSPFVHKPSQENFIKQTHARQIRLYDCSIDQVQEFLEYLMENVMVGVKIEADLFDYKEMSYGRRMVVDPELAVPMEEQIRAVARGMLESGLGADEQDEADDQQGGVDVDEAAPEGKPSPEKQQQKKSKGKKSKD